MSNCLNGKFSLLLLNSASKLLPKYGWKDSLYMAFLESKLNLSPSCLSGLFPYGQDVALVEFVRNQQCNEQMILDMKQNNINTHSKNLPNIENDRKRCLDILLDGIYSRIEFMSKRASIWPEAVAIALKASPNDFFINQPFDTTGILLQMSDLHFSDMEWYYFRALLIQILLSSEAMVCAAKSTHERDIEDIKIFVKNRIQSYYLTKHSISTVGRIVDNF